MLYRFGSCVLDVARGSLRKADLDVELRPKCFEVLRYLLANAGRLISKQELIDAVWQTAVVTDESIARCISDVRAAIHDDEQIIIKTVPRRGYVFAAPVVCDGDGKSSGKPGETPGGGSHDTPSIVVLPFVNLSGDGRQDYIADGITEDMTTEMSRCSEVLVIARNSAFQYKGKTVDVRQIGRELGVHYVLEGSVRRARDRLRITAQLVETTTGTHRWAERYDRKLDDVFAVQDDVIRSIVTILAAQLNKAEIERSLLKPPTIWRAYDFYMRASGALGSYWSSYKLDDLYEARRLLERAIEIDPTYARAYARLAATYMTAWVNPLDADHLSAEALDKAYGASTRAIQLDPNLPQAHAELGNVLARRGQLDAGIAAFRRAIELNPNSTDWRFAGALVFAGQPEQAIEVSETHMRLDPFHPAIAQAWRGRAYYMMRKYSAALPSLEDCVARSPHFRSGHLWLAATYAQLGRCEEAKIEAAEVLRINPTWTVQGTGRRVNVFKYAQDAEHLFDGLRKAGLPEK